MTTEVLCSTGCFSRESDPNALAAATAGMRELADTDFEVIFYRDWYEDPAATTAALTAVGARVPVLHAEKTLGPSVPGADDMHRAALTDRFEANCRLARELGAHLLVLHLWGLPDAERCLDEQLAILPQWADLADDHGLTLSIETLLCSGATPLATAIRARRHELRCSITLDLGFLAMQGDLLRQVDEDRLWAEGAAGHVHVKDLHDPSAGWGQPYLQPGEGTLDLTGAFAALGARGYGGRVTLESQASRPDGTLDLDRLDCGLEWIREATARWS